MMMKRLLVPRCDLLKPQSLIIVCLLLLLPASHARSPWIYQKSTTGAPSPPGRHWWGIVGRGGTSSSVSESTSTLESTPENQITSQQSQTGDKDTFENDTQPTNDTTTPLSNQTDLVEAWKQALPPPLCDKSSKTFKRICVPYQNHVAEIYLLGTAHVSNDSSRDVKLLLESLHPQVIFVELCEQRTALMEDPPEVLQNMTNNDDSSNQQKKKVSFMQKVQELQHSTNNSKLQCMATVLLTSTQEEYAESLGVELGGEFRVAYQYWRSFPQQQAQLGRRQPQGQTRQRPHLILGDRPLAITLARCWESLGFLGKCKVLVGLLISSFHKPSPEELRAWIKKILEEETDLLSSSLEELRRHFPSLERVIIQERDAYMACKLYQLCRGMLVSAVRAQEQQLQQQSQMGVQVASNTENESSDNNNNRIVICALVGAGHVPGICAWLTTKNHPEGPEAILDGLIATKKFANQDLSPLVYDVTELQDIPPPASQHQTEHV